MDIYKHIRKNVTTNYMINDNIYIQYAFSCAWCWVKFHNSFNITNHELGNIVIYI